MALRQEVSLTNQYVLLSEDALRESKQLREDVARKEERQDAILTKSNSTIESMEENLQSMERQQS